MNRLIALSLLAAYCCSAKGFGQVTLTHKFPDGERTTTITDVETAQTLMIGGMDIVTAAKQKITTTATNGKRSADGTLVAVHKVDAIKTDLDIAGQQLSFDSANPDAAPPGTALDILLDVFKAMSKSEWKVARDKDNRVTAVEGRDAALKVLPEALAKAAEKQFDPVYLAQIANDEMAAIPATPVSNGDSWELETTVRLDGGQTFKFRKTYTYAGVVTQDGKSLHRITEKTNDVIYDMEANPASPLKYVKSNLEVADSEGTTLFDNQAGRVVSRHSKVHITGPMTFEGGGNELPAELDLTMEQTSKVASAERG